MAELRHPNASLVRPTLPRFGSARIRKPRLRAAQLCQIYDLLNVRPVANHADLADEAEFAQCGQHESQHLGWVQATCSGSDQRKGDRPKAMLTGQGSGVANRRLDRACRSTPMKADSSNVDDSTKRQVACPRQDGPAEREQAGLAQFVKRRGAATSLDFTRDILRKQEPPR